MNQQKHFEKPVRQDLLASIVVFLVALPLCLGVAIASGAPPALGIISGIVGGLVVGALSGCPLQVTGPAAGLITIVFEVVSKHGLKGLAIMLVLAGIFQIFAGVFKLGQWFRAVSPAVIQGMLAGIGVIILASQFHVMLDDPAKGNGIENLLTIPQAIGNAFFHPDKTQHLLAASLGAMTILLMLSWELVPKKIKMIPAPLLAVILSVVIAAVFHFPVKFVEVPANLLNVLSLPDSNSLSLLWSSNTWITAITIAFVASAETLLTASAVDRMTAGRQQTNYEKEMIAQGVGNTLCGLIGALPVTGVIVRSATNVQAGGRTRFATMLHGTWILLFAMLFPGLLALIPIATLAAVLVYTGYKLVNIKAIRNLWVMGKGEVAIYFLTMIGIVTTSLLEGVILGIVAASVKLLYTFSRLDILVSSDAECEHGDIDMHLTGSATFYSIPKLSGALNLMPPGKTVHVHLENLVHIDHACLELLTNWEKQYQTTGGTLIVEWHTLTSKFRQDMTSQNERLLEVLQSREGH